MKKFIDLKSNEVLALAIKIEDNNANQYAEWADRFRPFNDEVSRLLDKLSQEEILHKSKLEHLFYRKFRYDPSQVRIPVISDAIEKPELPTEHFFVVSDDMAKKILLAAFTTEIEARRFYERALSQTTDLSLTEVYHILSDYEDEHVRKLEYQILEYQEQRFDENQNEAIA